MSLEYKKLGDVAKFIRGITYKPNDLVENFSENSTVCMRTANVQAKLKQDDLLSVPLSFVKNEEKFLIEGDLLVSTANSWNLVGKCCWVPKLDYSATAGGFISILRANQEKVDQHYLYHWFNSANTQLLARNCGRQTTNISNMDLGRCLDIKIPLPLLEEQRRIASILDKADELCQKRQQAIEKLDQLLQATFIEMFGDPILNTKNWPSDKKLGDIADIVSGITKGRKITGKSLREIPYLAVSNVQDKYLNLSVIKTIEASDEEIERYKLQQGDLLLTEGGDPDKLGRGTLWNNEVDECIHQNHVFRVRLTSKDFTPNYLNWIVGSEYGKRYFLKSAKQTTGIASINMGQLKKLPLLIPPLDLQIQFDERCNKFHQIKKQLAESYKDINNLFKSLQNQAFSGNL